MSEKRDANIQNLKAKIDEWNAELERLTAKANQAEGEVKAGYHQQAEELRAKRKGIEQRIEDLKDASDSAWEDLKQGVETSWEKWKESFSRAKNEFEEGYREGRKK